MCSIVSLVNDRSVFDFVYQIVVLNRRTYAVVYLRRTIYSFFNHLLIRLDVRTIIIKKIDHIMINNHLKAFGYYNL